MESIILSLIKSIPNTVWAALTASALTLGGVFLSNRSSTKRLKIQLEHDAHEKEKDRKNELRKNVYLKAAEEIVLANQHLASLSQVDLIKVNIGDGLKSLSIAASQVGLVASSETSKSVSELMSGFMNSFFKLSSILMPIQDIRTDINILNGQYENYSSNIQKILYEMEERNKSKQMDQGLWDALKHYFDFNQSQCDKVSNERNSKWKEYNRLQREFAKAVMIEMKSLSQLTMPALINIRKELDLETDEIEYKNQLEIQYNKMERSLEKFLSEIKEDG